MNVTNVSVTDMVRSFEHTTVQPPVDMCGICCESQSKACNDIVMNVDERCVWCRGLMCIDCVRKYLETTPYVLDARCPFCKRSWTDRESIVFATRVRKRYTDTIGSDDEHYVLNARRVDDAWTRRIARALFEKKLPELIEVEQRYHFEKTAKIFLSLRENAGKARDKLTQSAMHIAEMTRDVTASSQTSISMFENISRLYTELQANYFSYIASLDADALAHEAAHAKGNDANYSSRFRCSVPTCNGYANDEGSCTICRARHCLECECRIDIRDLSTNEDVRHVCDENVLATVRTLKLEAKWCPNCKVRAIKSEGCDDMFCPRCATCFDWKTLRVIAPRHNVDYDEHVRRTKGTLDREFGDVQCGGIVGEDVYATAHGWRFMDSDRKYEWDDIFGMYSEYDVHDFLVLMIKSYHACIHWKVNRNNVTQVENALLERIYCERNDDDDPNIVNYRNERFLFVHDMSRTPMYHRAVQPKTDQPIRRLVNDAVPPLTASCEPLSYFERSLYDRKMLDEGEEKYYEALFTFVACCNDVFRYLKCVYDELHAIRCQMDDIDYLDVLDIKELYDRFKAEYEAYVKEHAYDNYKTEYEAAVNEHASDATGDQYETNVTEFKEFCYSFASKIDDITQVAVKNQLAALARMLNRRVHDIAKAYGLQLYGVGVCESSRTNSLRFHYITLVGANDELDGIEYVTAMDARAIVPEGAEFVHDIRFDDRNNYEAVVTAVNYNILRIRGGALGFPVL